MTRSADQPRTTGPIQVAVIVSSSRTGRLAPQLADWLGKQLSQRGDLSYDVIDLPSTSLPDDLAPSHPSTERLRPRLARADAFVLVVPEYNRSIPGPLKTLVDSFNEEWEAKPFGFVAYGLSMSGGVRASEHLRQIIGEFHAVAMKEVVLFPRLMGLLDPDGTFDGDSEGSRSAARAMLDQLVWWAQALREAKAVRPYRR
jgi:NAD(P)H-dependent FMN reductase